MGNVRKHIHEEVFSASPEALFAILHTPTAICGWWGASRAIVIAEENGIWTAAWGDDPDKPDYVTSFVIRAFEPPRRMLLGSARYFARTGKLPFEAELTTEFSIEPTDSGSRLRVVQDGFPRSMAADDFYKACFDGWRNTFDGIRAFLGS
jgi:uncharacterized protein YndB with AHSA1/START domain